MLNFNILDILDFTIVYFKEEFIQLQDLFSYFNFLADFENRDIQMCFSLFKFDNFQKS